MHDAAFEELWKQLQLSPPPMPASVYSINIEDQVRLEIQDINGDISMIGFGGKSSSFQKPASGILELTDYRRFSSEPSIHPVIADGGDPGFLIFLKSRSVTSQNLMLAMETLLDSLQRLESL
jgi:hypothetical protein